MVKMTEQIDLIAELLSESRHHVGGSASWKSFRCEKQLQIDDLFKINNLFLTIPST